MNRDANSSFLYLSRFLAEITRQESNVPLAPIIAQMLACPVAFVDEAFRVMDASSFDVSEADWNALLLSKQKQFWQPPKTYNESGFFVSALKEPFADYRFEIVFPIFQDNSSKIQEGAIFFLAKEDALPTDVAQILQFVAHTLSWVMWRHVRQTKNRLAAQNLTFVRLLLDLLYGIIPTEEERNAILQSSFFQTERDFVLFVIESSASYDEDYSIAKLTDSVSMIFEDSITVCFSGDIVLLLPAYYLQEGGFHAQWNELSDTLTKNKCYGGISSVFHSIDAYFLHHFVRALSAARVARETAAENHFAAYTDEAIFNFIANGPPPFNLKTLCDPALLKLVEYDKKYNSDYFYTLMCYWQLDRDTPRICNYMHIHKNTLYYRLSKIKAFLNHDIDNHFSLLELNFSIAIMEYLNLIPKYRIRD